MPDPCASIPVIQHRGWVDPAGAQYLNENTLVAFDRAKASGAWAVETDMWVSTDGVPFLLHDDTLRRVIDPASMPEGVTTETRPWQLTIAQARALRTTGGQPVPTLRQALRWAGENDMTMFVELKWGVQDANRIRRWARHFAPALASQRRMRMVDVRFYASPHRTYGHLDALVPFRNAGFVVGVKDRPTSPLSLRDYADVVGPDGFLVRQTGRMNPRVRNQIRSLGLDLYGGAYTVSGALNILRFQYDAVVSSRNIWRNRCARATDPVEEHPGG